LRVSSWYKLNGSSPGTPNSPLNDLIAALSAGIAPLSSGKATTTELQGGTVLSPNITSFLNSQGYTSGRPKAYVNWIVLDEQFKYVSGSSGFEQVGTDQEFKVHIRNDLPISRSGYLYVYVSNETPNIDVFFDNLQVTHIRGPLLEETHYYPFGLTMAGISSKAMNFGGAENKRQFNGGNELQNKEFADGSGLDWYDATNRMYDPQTGRFNQIDPLSDLSLSWSPYTFSSDNPILRNDPLGLKDTVINGNRYKDLQEVVVTAKKKKAEPQSNNDDQSRLGRFWRRWVSHFSGMSTQVSNLYELGMNSMLRSNMVWLTGGLLERVKNDEEMKRHQARIIAIIKADPRYKKLQFIYSNTGETVEFGGKRAAGEGWFSVSNENPLLHKETWEVAADPLTWTLRHANIQTDAVVKGDGTIVLTHHVTDKLDLRPGDWHTPAYNKVTSVLGPIYHDVLRGSDNMQVRGSWSTTIK
jgi:RHS repeat-associated protein